MISAIVLAAGKSERMGEPKMGLPWGETTVIGQVVTTLLDAGLDEVLVITGGGRAEVEHALKRLPSTWPIRVVHNPDYAAGEMLSSIQVGVAALDESARAAMITLGDQPQMEGGVVRAILNAFLQTGAALVVPSYNMRRGHPMLIARPLWAELLSLRPPQTLRELLLAHSDQIHYEVVDTPTILQDIDTPRDYQRFKP
jgi:molybdenum cofactor cytidylyltransferase